MGVATWTLLALRIRESSQSGHHDDERDAHPERDAFRIGHRVNGIVKPDHQEGDQDHHRAEDESLLEH